MPWIHLTARPVYNRTIPEPFKSNSYDIHVLYFHEKCNFARLTLENRENCQASPPPVFFVFEGWGGVGWVWERINSFPFFKENKQYERIANNSTASL